jgi:DNA-binding NarL/FixJ family response regulator
MTAAKIRVLVADDHPIFRVGLRNLISQQADMEVVGEASDGPEAVAQVLAIRPDVTLLDLRMPNLDGPQVIAQVLASDKDARIIILTTYDGDEDIYRAVEAGARGYLLKDTFTEGILEAIRHVHGGGTLFGPEASARLAERAGEKTLTRREQGVLELVARGLTNREIQASLSLSEGTLKNHLKHIYEKLGVSNRTEAAHAALQRGYVRPG